MGLLRRLLDTRLTACFARPSFLVVTPTGVAEAKKSVQRASQVSGFFFVDLGLRVEHLNPQK